MRRRTVSRAEEGKGKREREAAGRGDEGGGEAPLGEAADRLVEAGRLRQQRRHVGPQPVRLRRRPRRAGCVPSAALWQPRRCRVVVVTLSLYCITTQCILELATGSDSGTGGPRDHTVAACRRLDATPASESYQQRNRCTESPGPAVGRRWRSQATLAS